MTLLITSVIADSPRELIARAEAAWAKGAEAIELRLDGLSAFRTRSVSERPAEPKAAKEGLSLTKALADAGPLSSLLDYIAKQPHRRFILTCRSVGQGGLFEGTEGEIAEILLPFILRDNVIFDVEFSGEPMRTEIIDVVVEPGPSTEPQKPDEFPPELWAKFQDGMDTFKRTGKFPAWAYKPRQILSAHDFEGKGMDAEPILQFASKVGLAGAVTKIAYAAPHITQSFEALDLMREHRERSIAIAMGEDGLWTRVLAKKLGAFGTFASLEADEATAPGQLTIDEMVHRYRWRDINESTKVYGVIGDPVAHSLSPLLFNHWFAEHGINAVYLPLRVRGGDEALRRFLDQCLARPWLDIGGFSVTIPHKEAALAWLGTPSDNLTRSVGALNTLCFRDGKAFGYNTDCYAAVASVAAALGRTATDLAGLRVHVLGAGGAARAILEGFGEAGCHITLFARSFADAARLGEHFQCDAAPWEERGRQPADILINTTPVGMWPNVDESPMDSEPPTSVGADQDRSSAEGSRDQGIKGTRDQDGVGRATPAAPPPLAKGGLGGVGQSPADPGVPAPATSSDNSGTIVPRDLRHYRLVFDLIYRPQETRLLRDARAAGCQTLNGLDMFLRQAAVQFELWTGVTPDLESARDAL